MGVADVPCCKRFIEEVYCGNVCKRTGDGCIASDPMKGRCTDQTDSPKSQECPADGALRVGENRAIPCHRDFPPRKLRGPCLPKPNEGPLLSEPAVTGSPSPP